MKANQITNLRKAVDTIISKTYGIVRLVITVSTRITYFTVLPYFLII